MYDSYRQRPAPYNPSHDTGPQYIPPFHESHSEFFSPPSVHPPLPPERRCRSVPRRVHKTSPPAGPPYPAYPPGYYDVGRNDGPGAHENTIRRQQHPIGFEAVASLSRSQSRSRSRLPMSPEQLNSHFSPSSPPRDLYAPSGGGAVISNTRSYTDEVVQNSAAFRPVPAPRNIPTPPSAPPPSFPAEVAPMVPTRSRLPTTSASSSIQSPSISDPRSPSDSCSHNFPRGSHRYSLPSQRGGDVGSSRNLSSPRPPAVEKLDPSLTFVRSFGRNQSNDRVEPSPRIIHPSKSSQRILVIDPQAMSVQVYAVDGRVVACFKVVGVQGGCFWTDEKLVLATHRGIRVCAAANGTLISESAIGSVVNTKPFAHGLLAVQSTRLSMYAGADSVLTRAIDKIRRPYKIFRRTVRFSDIRDVQVTARQRLVILDAGAIYITDDVGQLLSKIKPQKLACGALNNPLSICTDRFDNVIVSDTGNRRLLQFFANGSYMTTLLGWTSPSSPRRDSCIIDESIASVYGVTITADGFLMVIVSGGGLAEIRVYRP